jgi:hypothetical protein
MHVNGKEVNCSFRNETQLKFRYGCLSQLVKWRKLLACCSASNGVDQRICPQTKTYPQLLNTGIRVNFPRKSRLVAVKSLLLLLEQRFPASIDRAMCTYTVIRT